MRVERVILDLHPCRHSQKLKGRFKSFMSVCLLLDFCFYDFRVNYGFKASMCRIMRSFEPASAPYPSPRLIALHRSYLDFELWHYRDCTGRSIRDCILVAYAEKLVGMIKQWAERAMFEESQRLLQNNTVSVA